MEEVLRDLKNWWNRQTPTQSRSLRSGASEVRVSRVGRSGVSDLNSPLRTPERSEETGTLRLPQFDNRTSSRRVPALPLYQGGYKKSTTYTDSTLQTSYPLMWSLYSGCVASPVVAVTPTWEQRIR